MFSWICPRCGRENRASDGECAYCHFQEAEAAPQEAVAPAQPVETDPQYMASSRYATEAPAETRPETALPQVPRSESAPVYRQPVSTPPSFAPPIYTPPAIPDPPPTARMAVPPVETRRPMPMPYAPAPKAGMPVWLLIPLFALAFLGLGALLYFGYQRVGSGKGGFTGGEVAPATQKAKASNPLQKYVEVVGIRWAQDARKRPQAKFIAVNHGTAELNDLTANVTLWASTSRSEEDSVGTFTFKINSLGPNEAKEITTPLKTKLKMYELPDWQNLTAEVQLTSQ